MKTDALFNLLFMFSANSWSKRVFQAMGNISTWESSSPAQRKADVAKYIGDKSHLDNKLVAAIINEVCRRSKKVRDLFEKL